MSNEAEPIGGVEKRPIEVVPYRQEWIEQFQLHRRAIAEALGDVALRIEHIGSTAVPGLAAKPIIDILVVVIDSADESSYRPQLESAGYVLRVREPDWNEHRMFRTLVKDVHIHVYSVGCAEIERSLQFRKRLRANPEDRQRYGDTKCALARFDWPDMNAYAAAKTEIIQSILAAN